MFLSFVSTFSDNLGVMAGLVMFAVGSIAVVVPTPNGAGPWHFCCHNDDDALWSGKRRCGKFLPY